MTLTHWVIIVTAAVLITFDVWAGLNGRADDTISQVIWKISKYPIVPFTFGLLMGHFFWRN